VTVATAAVDYKSPYHTHCSDELKPSHAEFNNTTHFAVYSQQSVCVFFKLMHDSAGSNGYLRVSNAFDQFNTQSFDNHSRPIHLCLMID